MNPVFTIKNCYGCGVCVLACPQKIIEMILNSDGFYIPHVVNKDKCTNCNLCMDVCAYLDNQISPQKYDTKSYAAWSMDEQIRRECSSGGVGFEIGKQLIQNGYKACGVKYNAAMNRAEHFIATTVEDFIPSKGSKYIPSYTLSGFEHINRKENYLVTGTPCQIDSFRRYIRKLKIEKNFVLLDFFCHGVPSMLMWKKYTEIIVKQTGVIDFVSWRNKKNGWHDSYVIQAGGSNLNYSSPLSKGDLFFKMFLGNICLSKACYKKCKYKYNQSVADIRIGDLWGAKYKDNKDGVSALLVLSEKGNDVISQLNHCHLEEMPLQTVAEGQMKSSPSKPYIYPLILSALKSRKTLHEVHTCLRIINIPKRIISKTQRIFNKKK